MNLLIYELKKLLSFKVSFIVIIVLIVNAGKIYIETNNNPDIIHSKEYWNNQQICNFENDLSGYMDYASALKIRTGYEKHLNFLKGYGEFSADAEIYYKMYEHYKYLYNYNLNIETALENAEDNIRFYELYNNQEEIKKNKKTIQLYSNRYIKDYYNSKDYKIIFDYEFSSFLLVIISLIGSFVTLGYEYQNDTLTFIKTSQKGRKYIVIYKSIVLFIWIVLCGALLFVEDYTLFGLNCNLEGVHNPIYSIEDYQFSALSCSIFSYIILTCFIRILASFVCGLVFSTVILVLNNILLSSIINIGTLSFIIIISENSNELSIISYLNPIVAMQIGKYTKNLLFFTVSQQQILSVNFVIIYLLIMIVVIFFILNLLFKNNTLVGIKC